MTDRWIRLDNAAKIFPAAANSADTQVFRISCELYEPVDKVILQEAVNEASELFEVYSCVLKRGLFWYYFEASDIKPEVREEYKPPCAALYDKDNKGLLYEVTYYKNRINVEAFHALSDATGIMRFLECIVAKYLSRAHSVPEPILDYDASASEKEDDSFYKYYNNQKAGLGYGKTKACRIRGRKYPDNRISVVTGLMSVQKTLEAAHSHDVTITAYLAAAMLFAINDTLPERAKKNPVILTIPVNLRKRFPSSSARNFFGTVSVGYSFDSALSDTETVINSVAEELRKNLSQKNMTELVARYSSVENNFMARITPLVIKNVFLRAAYNISMSQSTGTFSNAGIVSLPEALSDYVRSFDICCSTDRIQACACSFGDMLSVTFTTPFAGSDVPKNFFRRLTDAGIDVEISSNDEEEEHRK